MALMDQSRPIAREYQALTSFVVTGRLGPDDLAVWRRVEGLSQGAAARWLGYRQPRVSMLERGEWGPLGLHERLLWGMARYYGIVGMDEGPPKEVGPKRRGARRKTVNPVDEYYKRMVAESQSEQGVKPKKP